MPKQVSFKILEDKAFALSRKLNKAICISVKHWAYRTMSDPGSRQTSYALYVEHGKTEEYPTVQAVLKAMKDLSNPPKDTGVAV